MPDNVWLSADWDYKPILPIDENLEYGEYSEPDLAEAFPPANTDAPKTKTPLPVKEILEEIRRRAEANLLTSSWNHDSGELSIWCTSEHPGKPCAKPTIRGNPILKAEHAKLAPPKP